MKKINILIVGTSLFFLILMAGAAIFFQTMEEKADGRYLVEINRIMYGMEERGSFFMPDLGGTDQIEAVSYLDKKDLENTEQAKAFFQKRNGMEIHIKPLIVKEQMTGFVRFDYKNTADTERAFQIAEGVIAISGIFILIILLFLRNKLVIPFLALRDMPYELAKGRLNTEIEENKSRFFGNFVWGISMLKDHLKDSQMKALKLEKEKKMLLLSVSHDIKTPLNSIKLYAKALEEGIYDTEETITEAAGHIADLSGEIEDFVQEIVKSSSEEIISIEIENTEFYLKDLVDQIREYYEPKCKLFMTDFTIGSYDNRLLKGSMDGAFEAVENIMENAFKYGDGRSIAITFYEEEYCQVIKIKNTGQQVKAEEMPHLFDSFYRGSNAGSREGNGLGLYICGEIMRKMEGEIFALAQEDGMSFHLVFQM